jgi:putative resolvase
MRTSGRKYRWVGKAAEELGLHPITMRRWMKMGKIQAVRVGIQAGIPRAEIERLPGQLDEHLLVLSARVSGHEQRPDLNRKARAACGLGMRNTFVQLWCHLDDP